MVPDLRSIRLSSVLTNPAIDLVVDDSRRSSAFLEGKLRLFTLRIGEPEQPVKACSGWGCTGLQT